MTKQASFEEIQSELKRLISDEPELTQEKFSHEYYFYVMGHNDVDDLELDKHFERFKKLLGSKADIRSPERLASYLRFLKKHYHKDGVHKPCDRDAAWSMYVELDTRIACQEFAEGDIATALASLAALFELHRGISKKFGHRCRLYYQLTTGCLNDQLRPFTSKYHDLLKQQVEIDRANFLQELDTVRAKLTDLRDELFKIAG